MFQNDARQLVMRIKRICHSLVPARKRFSFYAILRRLLVFSISINVFLYLLKGFDSSNCFQIEAFTRVYHNLTENEGNERVILHTSSGKSITSKDVLLAGAHSEKKVFLTIGVPTIERKKHNYLMKTLDSVIHNVSKTEDFTTRIVVLLADMKRSLREKRLKELTSKYAFYIGSGAIHIITAPPQLYPPLHGLSKSLGDTEERVFWRSKQVIDYAFLMQYCKSFSPYYLHLEDDVIATKNYDVYMRQYMKEKENTYWINLDFSNLGFIGELYRTESLENQARFFRLFYSEMPVDLLMTTYRALLGSEVADITYYRNLFEHIGSESSAPP